jgi:hypothetical protein
MSKDDIVIRSYQPGDEVAINDTFNEVFGSERSLAEWRWKFPPVPAGQPIMVALQGDTILAHYAGSAVRFQVDGRSVSAAQILDVYSTREARRRFVRRGLWVQTVETFFVNFGMSGAYPLLFGFPGRRALRLGVLQLGYDAVTPQPITYLSRRRDQGRQDLRRLPYRADLIEGETDPRIDQLWQRIGPSYPVAVVRDGGRFRRRYSGHPTVTYHRFLICPRFSSVAVAWGVFRDDGERLLWVDLVWDREHPGALALLSHLASRLAASSGAELEELWLNGDLAGQLLLESLGFVQQPEPRGLVLVARSFDPEVDVDALDQRVYVTMGDSDLV